MPERKGRPSKHEYVKKLRVMEMLNARKKKGTVRKIVKCQDGDKIRNPEKPLFETRNSIRI